MVKFGNSSNSLSFNNELMMPQEEMLEVYKKNQKFKIGIPKEADKNESRIALTPFAVEQLVNNGHQVLIENNAGKEANFSNNEYSECGAKIINKKEVIYQCDIILKVSPLKNDEIDMLKGNQILISSIHIAQQKASYFRKLMQKKITALAFEYIKDNNDCFPIVRSMDEISGSTSILIASEYLSNVHDGKGEMLGGVTGVNSSEVIILGAGTAGEYAARTAHGLGALVKVFDASIFNLRQLQNNIGQRIYTSLLQPRVLSKALRSADVVIGALHYSDNDSPFFVTEEMLSKMKKNSVIIDISIDHGACFETSKVTSHSKPIFVKHDVIHYCVPNLPARVSRTASYAFSNIFAPFLLKLADMGSIKQAIRNDTGIRNGVYLFNGILTKNYIGNKFNIPSQDINLLTLAF